MTSISRQQIGVACAAAFAFSGGVAKAATWTPTVAPLSYALETYPGTTFGAMPGFAIPGFHVANNISLLGATLTKVEYSITFRSHGDATVENTGVVNNYTLTTLFINSAIRTTLPGTIIKFNNSNLYDEDTDGAGLPQTILPLGTYPIEFDQADTTSSDSTFLSAGNKALLFAAVSVAGSVSWPFEGRNELVIGGGGSTISSAINPFADYEVEVTYTYDPPSGEVPEASTWVALAPLLGLGAIVYRRRQMARK